jgi:hypothetical protein
MLAKDNKDKPINMLRRKPKLSALKPTAKPNTMLAICTADSKKPACTKLISNVACSTGKAGGILPTWSAAQTPAKTMTHDG